MPNFIRIAGLFLLLVFGVAAPAFSQIAFVVDDRLSALRTEADLKATVVQRLRPPRRVVIFAASRAKSASPKFYRVAVTRRTRGWIHQAALVIPGRLGDDARLMKLIEETRLEKEGVINFADRMALCRLFIEKFAYSKLLPKALLSFAQDADRLALWLNNAAQKHLKNLSADSAAASARDYYLSDASLDRFNRLGAHFDYVEKSGEYVYDGRAYRQLLRHFPKSPEAEIAGKQLALTRQKLAQK
ncbi:MAG: hypothetical protein HY231_20290 [Acidobacteria bacterium]|nr:hypothetical protein [Acidobacteriota bacterium]